MSFLRSGKGWRSRAALAALLGMLVAGLCAAGLAQGRESGALGADSGSNRLAQYEQHLARLNAVVAACQKQRTAQACDPSLAGPDDGVRLSGAAAEIREIRYDWLRALLAVAGQKDKPAAAGAGKSAQATAGPVEVPAVRMQALSVDALLTLARQRLAEDAKQAGEPMAAGPSYAAERASLGTILAQPEFRGVNKVTARERLIEWLNDALNKLLAQLIGFGARSPWIAFVLRALLLAGICLGLVWALVRIERRARIRLVPDAPAGPGAPSAREWQLWLRDAQAMAAAGHWREAIHFVYWAAIARLESRRVWPADRARTPREYLGLLSGADPRRPKLAALTRDFERTWYGGREAGSSDYQAARELAAELGVE